MRMPNPQMRLRWLPERWQRWRLERGILTGRWTQEDIDRIHHRGREMYDQYVRCDCGQPDGPLAVAGPSHSRTCPRWASELVSEWRGDDRDIN